MKSVFNIHNPNYGLFNSNVPLPPMHNDFKNISIVKWLLRGEPLKRGIHLWGVKQMAPVSHKCRNYRFNSLTTSKIFMIQPISNPALTNNCMP